MLQVSGLDFMSYSLDGSLPDAWSRLAQVLLPFKPQMQCSACCQLALQPHVSCKMHAYAATPPTHEYDANYQDCNKELALPTATSSVTVLILFETSQILSLG